MAASVLQVKAVTCGFRVHCQKWNVAIVPSSNGVIIVQGRKAFVSALKFGEFFLKVINDEGYFIVKIENRNVAIFKNDYSFVVAE